MVWLSAIRRLLLFPICVLVAVGLPDSFLPNFSLFIVDPLAIIALLIWAVSQLVRSAMAAWRRDWRVSAIRLIAIVIVALFFRPVIQSVDWVSRYAHLTAFVAWNAINPVTPDKREGHLEVFNWGGQGLAAGASEERFLVRDPNGKSQQVLGIRAWPNYPDAKNGTWRLAGSYYLRILYYP